jgi:alkaline phosphatase D
MEKIKLAFTSCMDAREFPNQPVWRAIADMHPDALFLLGDQIYMDWKLKPKWKRIFVSEADGPQKFAEDMHYRYSLQWGVLEFRKLVCDVVQRGGRDRVLVTWDEHDMAWNNCYGEARDDGSSDPISDKKHGVPKLARDIAILLFKQFVNVLRTGDFGADYPLLPSKVLSPPSALRGVQEELKIGDLEVLVLDERFYRTAREHPAARILGEAQLKWLQSKVSTGKGLVVVAGSSPLSHRYLLSNQAWDDDHQPYPDYRRFLNAVERPVLYVGGDIHKNAYTGVLPQTDVLQVLASGAARGHKFKAVPGSFVLAEIDLGARRTLISRHSEKGLSGIHEASFDDRRWFEAQENVPIDRESFPNQVDPLFTALVRRHGAVPAECSPEQLDELFRDRLPKPVVVEALEVTARGASVALKLSTGPAALEAMCEKVAAAATTKGQQSVVLFVHGFNKPMAASVEQGVDLRRRYPGCEPLLFSWPSGDHAGPINFHTAMSNADDGAPSLVVLLPLFIRAARQAGLKSVLFARSLGARMVVRHEVAVACEGLDRVVLSAPAIPDAGHVETLNAMQCRAFVTLNREDATLKRAPLSSRLLGNHLPESAAARAVYIDCTDVDDAGTNHDYFLDGGEGANLQELHERLLYGRPLSTGEPPPGFVAGGSHLLVGA